MEILYILVPLAVIIAGVIVWAFLWSIRSGQFDDLEGPAHRILMDEDDAPRRTPDRKPGRTKKPPRRR
jgi:cbb3-type cytochrome oxidase maturation protein